MQENTATKTVWGLSLAELIISALFLVGCLFAFATTALVPSAVNVAIKSDAIPLAVSNGFGNTKDAAELKAVIDSMNDKDLAEISAFLEIAEKGDVQGLLEYANVANPDQLQGLIESFASLTDQQIDEIARKIPDVNAAELKKARDEAANVSPEQIKAISSAFKGASTQDLILGATGLATATALVTIAWLMLCCVFSLIAGILGVKNAKRPEKLGAAFVWSIVGAVAGVFSGRIVTVVLMIIDAVYINKARKFQPTQF